MFNMVGLFKKKKSLEDTIVSNVDNFSTFLYDKFEKQYMILKKTIEDSDTQKRLSMNINNNKK